MEDAQIIQDFRLFIREGLVYDYSVDKLNNFANYMDGLYYKEARKYNKVLNKIINNKSILFTYDIISNAHLDIIKKYIKENFDYNSLRKISEDNKKIIATTLNDFKMGLEYLDLNSLIEVDNFAYYMKGFYKKFPYLEVAKLLSLLCKNDKFDKNIYFNFFKSDCFDKSKSSNGHYMEISNYEKTKVRVKS